MKVELLYHTPEPERLVAAAAKLCYSQSGVEGILDDLTPDKTKQFLNMLMDLGHQSPIEHASFTFGIEGVSRSLLAQITRHRIASFSVKSQRYVVEEQFSYVIPPAIEEDLEAKELFVHAMEECQSNYNQLADRLQKRYMDAYLAQGKSEKAARKAAEKKAIEDARYVLPNACETMMVVTMNCRSLLNFFEQRCCNRAQWEIRDLACEMLHLVKKAAPTIFGTAGPSCVRGACKEGTMSCGQAAQVRKSFMEGEGNAAHCH